MPSRPCDINVMPQLFLNEINRWLSARLQCLQYVSNGDTAVLHYAIELLIKHYIINLCNKAPVNLRCGGVTTDPWADLTHWGRMTQIWISKLTIIVSDNSFRCQAIYLNQCWNIVNSNFKNKFQRNLKRNSYIFIQENAFENVVWERAAILPRPQSVKWLMAWRSRKKIHQEATQRIVDMMTSSIGNIFRITGHLFGEFTGPRWIPRTKASDDELWCFLSSASE